MLRKLRPGRPSHATVVAYTALFVALGGTAYAVNTVGSSDIIDEAILSVDIKNGEVKAPDVAGNAVDSARVRDNTLNTFDVHSFIGEDVIDGTLTGADIQNGSLKDEDVGEAKLFDVAVTIGSLPATNCVNKTVAGLGAQGDHILVTPAVDNAHGALMYDARYDIASGDVTIHVCNFSGATIDDGVTNFNVLVFAHL